jgi:hypothetical protein
MGRRGMHTRFWWESQRKIYHKDELDVNGRIICTGIIMDLRDRGWGGTDWIDLAQDKDQWRAILNTVMNFRFP